MENEEIVAMLSRALGGQRRSVKAFELIAAATRDQDDKQLILTMRREERRHYYLLEGIYEEISGQPYTQARLSISLPKNYCEMLKVAICEKLEAIDFYEQLDAALICVKQRELLAIIIGDQKEQARILASIYQRSC